ncbi:hypothetical protein O181_107544 [Austropuccinia psidii MF-1]|uniref:Uncharacterized protein n=1 Tax=Austropuccinia psidii MF-1 TaxID=1389203 RepID=A0A9Q3PN41_9BASI|nr:hypothetical protein [Austropuccinia psidii MF-1]
MKLDFKEGDQVKNEVEVKLTEEFSRKHPVLPVSLVKASFQKEEDNFPSRKKNPTPPDIVEVEDSPLPVKKIIKARKIGLNGEDLRQYLVRFKTRQQIQTNGWQKMHYQVGSFNSGPLGGLNSLINDEHFLEGGYVGP